MSINGEVHATTEAATAQAAGDVRRRHISEQMRAALDAYAQRVHGVERFLDVPAHLLDVNEADKSIGGRLQEWITFPSGYAESRVAMAEAGRYAVGSPAWEFSRELAAALKGKKADKLRMERKLRKFLGEIYAVWSYEWLPALIEANAAARAGEADGEPISGVLNRLAENGRLQAPSSFAVYELGRAVALKDFRESESTPFPAVTLKNGHAELRPSSAGADEHLEWAPDALRVALDTMGKRLETLGHRARDVYYVMLARWLQHRASGQDGNPWIGVSEILEALGFAPSAQHTKTFTERDVWEVRQAIESLGSLWVNLRVNAKKKRQAVQVPYRGHFLMLGDRRGQGRLDKPGLSEFDEIEFAVPALMAQGLNSAVVPYLQLHIKALQYRENQAFEKSTAYFLAEMARVNAKGGSDRLRFTPERLLQEAGMFDLDAREASRTRKRVHSGLNRLVDDGVLEDWRYSDADWDDSLQRAMDAGKRPRGWVEEWLKKSIEMILPQGFTYVTLAAKRARHAEKVAIPAPPTLFELEPPGAGRDLARRVLAAIARSGLSKKDAAEAMQISRPTLDTLLKGGQVRETIKQRASGWAASVLF